MLVSLKLVMSIWLALRNKVSLFHVYFEIKSREYLTSDLLQGGMGAALLSDPDKIEAVSCCQSESDAELKTVKIH